MNVGVYQLGIAVAILYPIPLILIAVSKQVSGTTKLGWFLVTVLLSWLAYLLFLMAITARPRS